MKSQRNSYATSVVDTTIALIEFSEVEMCSADGYKWKVGDKAVSLTDKWKGGPDDNRTLSTGPRKGEIVTVLSVWRDAVPFRGVYHTSIEISQYGTGVYGAGYAACAFRPITQDKREACEEEFKTLLKGMGNKLPQKIDTEKA